MYKFFIRKILLISALILSGCSDHQLGWDHIIRNGELRFVTVESPETYYMTPSGPDGFEYQLAKKFTDYIGVELKLLVARDSMEVMSIIDNNKASLGGAALMDIKTNDVIKTGPAYYSVPRQLIYRSSESKPDNHTLNTSGSPMDLNSMMKMFQDRTINSTVANLYQVNLYKHLYPEIRVASSITKPLPVAWVYRKNDVLLDNFVYKFFNKLNRTGELDRLVDQYFGHMYKFDYIDTSTFLTRIENRLPRYENLFRETGDKYKIDWTLLAAMSYQESHWQESARSPTGVRGLMMLTLQTANQFGITDRTDPEQSVDGGTRYFKLLMEKIPARIDQPDRTWMALAAYNVGLQRLEQARIVTQKDGNNPDLWSEVRKTLLKLADESEQNILNPDSTRWREPVIFVRNIRKYRDILRWKNFERERLVQGTALPPAFSIDSPVL